MVSTLNGLLYAILLLLLSIGKNLDMKKTLQQNGIEDESEAFYELNIDEDDFLPAIHLYFNDDLTEF